MDKQMLWVLLNRVPKGKITTYKELAKALDTSPRAIGAMLHSNKNPDRVPCYKVIMSNGALGGFACGVEDKIKRLEKEGITVKDGMVVNFEKHLYQPQKSTTKR